VQNVYPALRITDYEKSKAFYVDGLGFQIEGEHLSLSKSSSLFVFIHLQNSSVNS
jgi:catechol 2,3-dioxygenase-like lactoylglutathione lyase family enzyme